MVVSGSRLTFIKLGRDYGALGAQTYVMGHGLVFRVLLLVCLCVWTIGDVVSVCLMCILCISVMCNVRSCWDSVFTIKPKLKVMIDFD